MNWFSGNGVGIHGWGSAVDWSLESFVLNWVVVRFQDYLGEKFDSLGYELRLEGKSELGYLSVNPDVELTSEGIHQLVYFVFWVFFCAVQSSMGCEVGDWAVGDVLLTTSCLDNDCDAEYMVRYDGCPPTHDSEQTRMSLPILWNSVGLTARSASGIYPWGSSPKSTSLCLLNWSLSLLAGVLTPGLVTCENPYLRLLANLRALPTLFINIIVSTQINQKNQFKATPVISRMFYSDRQIYSYSLLISPSLDHIFTTT